MLTSLLYASLALGGTVVPPLFTPTTYVHGDLARAALSPHIELWANSDAVYQRGDRVHVYFRTDQDAYITVFRIDTDGRVRVVFPLDPWEDNFARGGHKYEVAARNDDYAFRVDDYPGEGYLFAIASADPFDYATYVRGDHWDYRAIASGGRVTGDPYVAFGDLVSAIIPANYVDYSYDVAPYYVQEHYSYPRFVCYNCHAYAAYPYWDPYVTPCFRYRVVIYDDPYYYGAYRYGGTRVVYVNRPHVFVPRFVFKDRDPGQPYVATVRQRPVDPSGRRLIDPGVSARAVGGVGRVPAPIATNDAGRRAMPNGGVPTPGRADVGTGGRRTLPQTGPTPSPQPSAQPDPRETPRSAPAPVLERRNPQDRPAPAEPTRQPTPQSTPRPTPTPEPSRRPDPQPQQPPPRREPARTEPSRRPPPQAEPRHVEAPRSAPSPRSAPAPSRAPGRSSPGRRTGH